MKIIFDAEMTGCDEYYDEILQLSIINEEGETLLNEYYKPKYISEWQESERIHGITPEMVKDCDCIDDHLSKIQAIFDQASELIGYNTPCDLSFLRMAGIRIPDVKITDVMVEFSPIYAEAKHKKVVKSKKLITCAAYYGYEYEAHNSLNDALATLYCYQQIHKDEWWRNLPNNNGIWCF